MWITGTVRGPVETRRIRLMNPSEAQNIDTVVVEWDEQFRGSDTVPLASLEVVPA
jgi:hypothetical protein